MPKSVKGVMGEFKNHQLHSGGSGKVVTNPKQAIAIALSEQRQAKPSTGSSQHRPIHNLGGYAHPPRSRKK